MEFAVVASSASGRTADPEWMSAYARHAEACGFESLVLVEHAVMASEYASEYPYAPSGRVELAADVDIPDPLEMLSFLAGRTERLGLATGVLVLPVHQPVVLAKRLATLDRISGGRLRICVGMGWLREELEACDVPFTARGRRANEQIEVLRKLWAGGPDGVSHHGEFFDFDHAVSYPKPVQAGGVPLHIGGHTPAAARRAGRYGNGLQPLGLAGEALADVVALMRRTAEEHDRDPNALELSLGHLVTKINADRAASLEAQGATRIVLAASDTGDLEQAKDELSACAERLGL
ncbi:LLM class F420-dependent oxidoreductase [Nocardioides dubius]|uniref:LLM class F420-dependent oxidoreductase n=1 Tax=Nocardioides dubius TaxID=317019 RepID=A0ABP4EE73_9ACTN